MDTRKFTAHVDGAHASRIEQNGFGIIFKLDGEDAEVTTELVRRWNAHDGLVDLAHAVIAGNTEHEDLEKMARAAVDKAPEPSTTKTYTVILLRPDYATSNYGQDTWCGEGKGATPKEAMKDAKRSLMEDDSDIKEADDLFVIACIEGSHKDHSPEQHNR